MTAFDSVNSHSVCNSVWSDVEIVSSLEHKGVEGLMVWTGQPRIDQSFCANLEVTHTAVHKHFFFTAL